MRKSYPASYKLEVIESAEMTSNTKAAQKYNINESCIRSWRKSKDKLLNMNSNRKSQRTGTPIWPEIDKELKQWADERLKKNQHTNAKMIKEESLKIALRQNATNFSGSKVWIYSFM